MHITLLSSLYTVFCQVLDLTKNQLNVFLSLNPVWPNITQLSKLFLRDNGLKSLHPGQFLTCLVLTLLDLSENKLEYLPIGFLHG